MNESVYTKYDKTDLAVALVDIDGEIKDLVILVEFALQSSLQSEYQKNQIKESIGRLLFALDSVEVERMGRE